MELLLFSDAGTNSTAVSSEANSPTVERHVIQPIQETIASPQYQVASTQYQGASTQYQVASIQYQVASPQY